MNKTIINTGAMLLIMAVGTVAVKSMINAEKIFNKVVKSQKNEKEG